MTLFVTLSLDGIITEMNMSDRWSNIVTTTAIKDNNSMKLDSTINTAIIGKTNYLEMTKFATNFPYANSENYILTHNSDATSNDDTVSYIKENHIEFLRNVKAEDDGVVWVVAGFELTKQLLKEKLIDEIDIYVISEYLNEGDDFFGTLLKDYTINLLDTGGVSGGTYKMRYGITYKR